MVTTEREAYLNKLKAQFSDWNTKINSLKAKAESVKPQAQIEYWRQMDLLFAKMDELQEYLTKLKHSDDNNWEELKVIAEKSIHELKDAFDSAVSKLD